MTVLADQSRYLLQNYLAVLLHLPILILPLSDKLCISGLAKYLVSSRRLQMWN